VNCTDEEIEQVGLDTLLRQSDFVVPLAVATEETENLINRETIALMKPDVYFVNVSRGNLVDEAALAEAYREGRIAIIAMDVGRGPDQRPSPQMAEMEGVVATPHLGGLTVQNAEAQAWSAVEQVEAIVKGVLPPRAVNPQSDARLKNLWLELSSG
jgi:D-3-phosphoglycerate dehydrogenase